MECLYGKKCGRTCDLSTDPVNKIVFADEECRNRYHRTKKAAREAIVFDAKLFGDLWFIHVALTRQVILSFLHNNENTQWRINELLANQADLGRLLGLAVHSTPFGQAAQKLLETHIVQAKGLLEALADKETTTDLKLDRLFVAWNDNGREIVAALASALLKREQTHEREVLDGLMLTHLSLTYSEMKRSVAGATKESLYYYDEIMYCVAEMSRDISNAIEMLQ